MIKDIIKNSKESDLILTMPKTNDDMYNDEELQEVLKQIEKSFGKGAALRLGDKTIEKISSISTGSFLINQAIGVGGYPKGRIIEIFGPESSGKTTLALHAIAEAQKAGGNAAFIDAEHALDPLYAKNIGVDINKLIVSQPDSGEQGLDILEVLVKSSKFDLIVIDSVAALVPLAELSGEMGDQQIGLQARLMSKALRKLNGVISRTNTTVIFINQLREKVGVIFGNPEITPGGRALRFYSSVRLEIRKSENVTLNGEIVASKAKVKVVKNKVNAPFKNCVITIEYNKGINSKMEIVELASNFNVINKAGAWYSYGEIKIGQGKESVVEWFEKNPDKFKEIEKKLQESLI